VAALLLQSAMAAIIKVLSGGAMRRALTDAAALFERATGDKADIRFALTSVLVKDVEQGADFDVAILPRPELDGLATSGKIAAGSRADIARSAVGLAVRAGAPKPDISTADTFRRTLLQARSIAYSDGPSGLYIAGVLERLGILDDMKPKTKLVPNGGPVAELVARGEAEFGLQQIVAILPVQGVELAGPLPRELQNIIVYAAGLSGAAADSSPGLAFLTFLRTEEVARIIRASGMEPG